MASAPRMVTVLENNTRRLEALEAQALEVFSNKDKATRWMREPNPALGDNRPIDLVATNDGYETVMDVLVRIESGTYS